MSFIAYKGKVTREEELMMKILFNVCNKYQPDPFIFEDGDKLYLYVTAEDGVEAYSASSLFDIWCYEGIVAKFQDKVTYWAPSVIKYNGRYYIYVSCNKTDAFQQYLHVASADTPLGPFKDEKCLFDYFSIDSHVVHTKEGLFLWYAKDEHHGERIGTRVFVDRLIDPYTPAGNPVEKIVPSFDEEKYTPYCTKDNNWHTIEGPFWFKEGGWQYLMYSGGCYLDDTYHVGYAVAKTEEEDLTKVNYEKFTNKGKFSPLLIKNDYEEGTGHNSVIKYKGNYYMIYHGRDYGDKSQESCTEKRTARVCRLSVENGILSIQR